MNTCTFPLPLPKKKMNLWKRKKEKEIMDLFELRQYKCLYAKEIEQLKKINPYKWCLLTDFFISEIQEIILARWKQQKQQQQDQEQQLQSQTQNNTCTRSSHNNPMKTTNVTKKEIIQLTQEIMNCFSFSSPLKETTNVSDQELASFLQICTQKLEQQVTQKNPNVIQKTFSTNTVFLTGTSDRHLIDKSSLKEEELKKLEQVNQMLRQDFKMRRELMIERFDVTLKSFLWSERGKKNEKEILEELYQAKQKNSFEPVSIELTKLYQNSAKNLSQLFYQKEKIQEGSNIRNLLIGQVPDRGGRTTDLKEKDLQKALKDPWAFSSSTRKNYKNKKKQHGWTISKKSRWTSY
jgi:hypothetical protein